MLRATLKSMLARKVRLLLSGLAVTLGVMFVAGSFVLTDTLGRSFDNMFASSFTDVDVLVTAKPVIDVSEIEGEPISGLLRTADVSRVGAMPGVEDAVGLVQADGARLIGSDGKVVATYGPPRFGESWVGEIGGMRLREGRGPTAADEIAVNAGLAKAAGVNVGDRVGVLTNQPKQMFTITGVFGFADGLDAKGDVQQVQFTEPVAQRLMLGAEGLYTSINVTAAAGTDPQALAREIATRLGDGYLVRTGTEAAEAISQGFKDALDVINKVLLGFAGVALFVGTFLILNTFSIIVAQRTRELALNRALGASRGQVIGSVLVEATVIGLLASVLGLAAGVGIGAALATWAASFVSLAMAGVGVPVAAVIGSFAVGLIVTWVAALLPAVRASRIPPVAALQESAIPDRPLTRLSVAGILMACAGAGLLGYGLAEEPDGLLWWIVAGVAAAFIGVALLSPVISRPVVSMLGRLFAWGVAGRLGRLNSGRNPRRTAITAAALMVGIALITGANTVISSVDRSIRGTAQDSFHADLLLFGQGSPDRLPTFEPELVDEVAAIAGVRAISAQYAETAQVAGELSFVRSQSDLAAYARMVGIAVGTGLPQLGRYDMLLGQADAVEAGLKVGDEVEVRMPRGEPHRFRLVGLYRESPIAVGGPILGAGMIEGMRSRQPSFGFVELNDGADAQRVRTRIAGLLGDNPEIMVEDREGYLDLALGGSSQMLLVIQVLLALAILIAVLGVVNTLALSVLERTRELGLLRAIGLGRSATMRMITAEAVVITVFGALLGVVVGSGLGAALVRALRSDGVTTLVLPWQQIGMYLGIGAAVGVLAAVLPAISAARINVLTAIAHE